MKPVKPSRIGRRKFTRRPHRPARRPHYRCAARLRPGMGHWGRPPNPLRLLIILVRRILKFHESEPLLNPEIITKRKRQWWKGRNR